MLGSGLGYLVNYLIILPLSITFEFSSVWNVLFSIFIILMVYDFFYYLMHRFLFHGDNHFFKTVHAVHHQMKNPSRGDSSYLHWLEGTMGVLLFGFTVGGLSLIFGKFDLVSIVITMWLYQEINLHNHAIFDIDTFPFKTLHKTKHTLIVEAKQKSLKNGFNNFILRIQISLDAKLAEVVSYQGEKAVPFFINISDTQSKDEKLQQNRFFTEWLESIFTSGISSEVKI